MKRIFLFLLTNLAAVAMLTLVASVVLSFLGADLSELTGNPSGWMPLLVFSFIFGMAGSLVSLFLSKTMVRYSMRCRTITGTEGDDERWLVQTVEDLARRAGVKTPEVAIYPGEPNAFATGAFKNAALVAVSDGILRQMSREELRAVLAHEMSHVKNGDMVTMCLTQGVVNTFVIFFAYVLAFLVESALSRDERGRRRGSFGLGYLLRQIFQLLFGVLAAVVVMWYSRRREFAADAGSADLLGSPMPMITALQRLGGLKVGAMPSSMKAFGIAGGIGSLFASHPRIEDRIKALMELQPGFRTH
ncbi:MAG: protease HtpX [Kiritimatiellia bacterium]